MNTLFKTLNAVMAMSIVIILTSICSAQSGIQVTRYDGVGTSNYLELSDNTITEILNNGTAPILEYKAGKGPVQIENISDPTLITGNYRLKILDANYGTTDTVLVNWILEDIDTNDKWLSDVSIDSCNVQEITGRGFSLKIAHPEEPGDVTSSLNGFLGASLTYTNSSPEWLNAIKDDQFVIGTNFIRTGLQEENYSIDPNQVFSNVLGGMWSPYPLVSWKPTPVQIIENITPAWTSNFSVQVDARNDLESINNVNIVLTPDKSKWSRCIVVNTFSDFYQSEGLPNPGSSPYNLRTDPSVDQNGLPDNTNTTGMSWFPGYAIDVETGQRLNIFFGENTYYHPGAIGVPNSSQTLGLPTDNGKDMIWNPNQDFYTPIGQGINTIAELPCGGQHFTYVTNEPYDQCAKLATELGGSPFSQILGWTKVKWTTIPVLNNGTSLLSMANGLIPNEVAIKLRVNNRFSVKIGSNLNNGFPMYEFSLDSTFTTTENLEERTPLTTLSPNPMHLKAAVAATLEDLPVDCKISVFDALGTLKGEQHSTTKIAKIHPKGLGIQSPGLYYVVITSSNSRQIVKKWLIM